MKPKMSLAERLRAKYPELQKEPMMDELMASGGAFLDELPEDSEMDMEAGGDLMDMMEDPLDEDMLGSEDEELDIDMDMDMELEEGDEDAMENYEDEDMMMLEDEEDIDMMANSPDMRDEEESKKKAFKRRMALRRSLGGKA